MKSLLEFDDTVTFKTLFNEEFNRAENWYSSHSFPLWNASLYITRVGDDYLSGSDSLFGDHYLNLEPVSTMQSSKATVRGGALYTKDESGVALFCNDTVCDTLCIGSDSCSES